MRDQIDFALNLVTALFFISMLLWGEWILFWVLT